MPEKILIIDDHNLIRRTLRMLIKGEFPECHIIEAASGEEGVTLTMAESPRVVIMDVGLPRMNGIEATRQIKAAMPQVQVIILTNYDDDSYRGDALTAGARAYLLKGISHAELMLLLRELLPIWHDEPARNNVVPWKLCQVSL